MKFFFAIVAGSGVVGLFWLGWIVWEYGVYGGKRKQSNCQMDYDSDLFI